MQCFRHWIIQELVADWIRKRQLKLGESLLGDHHLINELQRECLGE
ncbi:hypothetical protein OROMI_006927 [Orobanche minor]